MTVRMMHYDPRWPQEFEQTRSGILQSCQGDVTEVCHIGSTAVSGLVAQPIIDLVAAVRGDVSLSAAAQAIEGLYFRIVAAPTWAGENLMLVKPRHGEVTHRLLLTRLGSSLWNRTLAVRDTMREDPERAVRFEEFKIRHWKAGEGIAQQYARDKSLYFAHLEEQLGLGN